MGGRYLTGAPSWPGGRGRGAGQGWAHSLRSPAHVASMLIIHVYKIYIIYAASVAIEAAASGGPTMRGLLRGGHSLPLGRPAKTIASPIYEPPLWTPPQSMGGAFS